MKKLIKKITIPMLVLLNLAACETNDQPSAENLLGTQGVAPYDLAASYRQNFVVDNNTVLWNPNEEDLRVDRLSFEAQLINDGIDDIFGIADYHRISSKNAYGFYDTNAPGAAFANIYAAKKKFKYGEGNDIIETEFAEYCFQSEKFRRYGNMSLKGAFQMLHDRKGNDGWGPFVGGLRELAGRFADKEWWKTWDNISIAVMSKVHAARFKAEPELFLALVATQGNTLIVENSGVNDGIWGNGPPKVGHEINNIPWRRNQLGLLYMLHRQRFWYDFKNNNEKNPSRANFDAKNVSHIKYMLQWLEKYDGGVKPGILSNAERVR